jgi:hypothetical protein
MDASCMDGPAIRYAALCVLKNLKMLINLVLCVERESVEL